jgi:acetyltransferase
LTTGVDVTSLNVMTPLRSSFAMCQRGFGDALVYDAASVRKIERRRFTMSISIPDNEITLRDGRSVHIRAVRPTDEAEIVQAFDRMSEAARFMRFMRFVREPNMERLRKALASFPESGVGIVATVPADDGIDIVGSAIAIIGSDPTSCEFAINVGTEFGGAGLASTLMRVLIDAMSQRGLKQMEGFVLAENQPMLRLAKRLGFTIAPDPDDRAVRICRLQLTSG